MATSNIGLYPSQSVIGDNDEQSFTDSKLPLVSQDQAVSLSAQDSDTGAQTEKIINIETTNGPPHETHDSSGSSERRTPSPSPPANAHRVTSKASFLTSTSMAAIDTVLDTRQRVVGCVDGQPFTDPKQHLPSQDKENTGTQPTTMVDAGANTIKLPQQTGDVSESLKQCTSSTSPVYSPPVTSITPVSVFPSMATRDSILNTRPKVVGGDDEQSFSYSQTTLLGSDEASSLASKDDTRKQSKRVVETDAKTAKTIRPPQEMYDLHGRSEKYASSLSSVSIRRDHLRDLLRGLFGRGDEPPCTYPKSSLPGRYKDVNGAPSENIVNSDPIPLKLHQELYSVSHPSSQLADDVKILAGAVKQYIDQKIGPDCAVVTFQDIQTLINADANLIARLDSQSQYSSLCPQAPRFFRQYHSGGRLAPEFWEWLSQELTEDSPQFLELCGITQDTLGESLNAPAQDGVLSFRSQRDVLDVGLIRYPTTERPYIVLERLKLSIWMKAPMFLRTWNCGMRGEFYTYEYKPRSEEICHFTKRVRAHALEYYENARALEYNKIMSRRPLPIESEILQIPRFI